ncbi:MAG: hypothetical protein HIU83_13375 [Proteobacteria bacterium]|nr:hypothetical protein [Pseudomonadota bacterium]
MGLSDISLAAGMYKNLLALNDTSVKINRTQERLATGKKVNSALDNPTNYFTSQAHLNRAEDLNSRKDGMSEAIRNGDAANAGLTAITSLIDSAKGLANSAHSASAGDRAILAAQFNGLLVQIDTLAGDSGYRGTNLLKNDNLTINFDENGSSNLTINGVDATSGSLGISKTDSPSSQQQVSFISTGYTSLALKSDGSVVAWGDNSYGQTNVPAAAQSGVVAVASGGWHELALKDNGSVIAWGAPWGDNSTVPAAAKSGVVAVAAGYEFSLALKSDGSVVAWGDNTSGQTTVPAAAQSGVVAISAGRYFSLALKSDGSVVAWGDNSSGETTIPLAAQSGVVAIAAGDQHALALKNDGTLVSWGYSGYGLASIPLAAQSSVVAIDAGGGDSLALKNDGTVVAWGDNSYGQATVPSGLLSGNSSGASLSWSTDAGIKTSEKQLETAMNTLRVNFSALSSSLSVIAIRQDFTQQIISTLQTGSDNLTLADMNEEGANMLMLQTRQSLSVTSLSLSSQALQSVLKLFT